MTNYWIKYPTHQAIIIKTKTPNKDDFEFYAHYFNMIDVKGLGLMLNPDMNIEVESRIIK